MMKKAKILTNRGRRLGVIAGSRAVVRPTTYLLSFICIQYFYYEAVNEKKIKNYLKFSGNSVALIPLEEFKTKHPFPDRVSLFKGASGSRIIQPNKFHDFIQGNFSAGIFKSIGSLESDYLNNCYVIMVPVANVSMDTKKAMEVLHKVNMLAYNFIANLWHFRDNCVNSDAGYLIVKNEFGSTIHKNNVRIHFHDTHGKDKNTVEFNYEEIKKAAFQASETIELHFDAAMQGPQKPTTRVRGVGRVAGFSAWINDARQQSDVLIKIATYITALETLFSTSNAELSHQLSERIALLNPHSKALPAKDSYMQMKKAYTFRSKALHGATVKPADQDNLLEVSVFLDNVCRQLKIELVTSEKFRARFHSNDSIDSFVYEKLFGNPPKLAVLKSRISLA